MARIIYTVFFFLCTGPFWSQEDLHQWYESNDLGIDFNQDQSQVLVVGFDRATLWNTADGTLVKSMPLTFNGEPIAPGTFTYIDAAPDLSEFLFEVNNSYRRFKLDIEDVDLFPDFQKHNVKKIVGYDSRGWMVFFSEGFYQGFYRVWQQGNISNMQFISLEYISEATMSNDHNYILFGRDQTFRYIDISGLEPKKAVDTGLPAENWKDEHLPPGQVTLYDWNGNNKDGKEVEWRYFIELGKELGKKIKGKNAQSYFPTDDYCLNDYPFYVFGATDSTVWGIYYAEKDLDRAEPAYQYYLEKSDRATCETLQTVYFTESEEANTARKQKKRDDYFAAKKEEKAKESAMRPTWYAEYMAKFINLPNTYTLNYETIAGVDVTNFPFVQNEKYRMGNPQEMAIGRICNCPNGNKVVLRVTRSQSNGMDRQSFRVFTYDSMGNEIGHQKIAETQKYNGNFPQLSYFTITSSDSSWTANVTIKYPNGNTRKETYNGTCN